MCLMPGGPKFQAWQTDLLVLPIVIIQSYRTIDQAHFLRFI
uniref:Uncharacterized protein n=1 Tax=Rhizophora mucronata TaxID=61149 RepID=A0A2P2QCS1_RHIMU